MSNECFCDYDRPEFYSKTVYTARKEHRCAECGRAIRTGERYEKVVGKWDGRMDIFKTCSRCTALRDHLSAHIPCFCWSHGNLLDDIKTEIHYLPVEAEGTGLIFELGRMAVAIKRAPRAISDARP